MSKFSSKITDQEQSNLWRRFKGGDKDALGDLARCHYRLLFGYGEKFSKDPDFIRDCIQELFLKLWERRKSISETEFVKSYLLKSLRNTIIDENIRLRRFRQPEELSFDADPVDNGAEFFIIEKENDEQQARVLRKNISQLTKRQQEIIYLRFYQGLTNQQTADIMGVGLQSVANLLYRTLKEIKENWVPIGLTLVLTLFVI